MTTVTAQTTQDTLVSVTMKLNHEPVKRIEVCLQVDDATQPVLAAWTDRNGQALFQVGHKSGQISVDGRIQYQGPLGGEIKIELLSLTGGETAVGNGAPPGIGGGSIAYPSMQTRTVQVNGIAILTDSEGYIVHPSEWSDDFARALATQEELVLTDEHWEVIRYLRDYFATHHVQCTVRDMIKHFRTQWGPEKGNNRYLHEIFPNGGPQKQGNRLAGLLRTKGEH